MLFSQSVSSASKSSVWPEGWRREVTVGLYGFCITAPYRPSILNRFVPYAVIMGCGGLTDLAVSGLTGLDILGCLRSVVAFVAVLLAPGYCLAWACDLLGFRGRAAGERLAWGVALSFGGMTIVSILLGKYGSLTAVCWLAGICAVGFVGIVMYEALRRPGGFGFSGRTGWVVAGIAAAWVVFIVGELVDIGVGSRLYFSVTVFDHSLRTAFVDAVLRTGVPPANPLYWPGHAAPMRYYYFWYVLVATAAKLAGATARQAMIASAAWVGLGLAATLELYCKNFLGSRTGIRRPRLVIALGLLTVTGLDILPVIAMALAKMPTDGDMEWWSADQVSSWLDSVLWVPHHVAGLVCCLLGFLLVWLSKEVGGWQRWVCGVIAGLSFASAFGLSTWVTLAFALVMMAWMLWALLWERDSRWRVATLLVAGVVAAVALMPYLAELRGEASGRVNQAPGASGSAAQDSGGSVAQSASHLLQFGVRHVIPAESVQGVGWIDCLAKTYPTLEGVGAGLVLLLPGYFVELGFYGFVLGAAVCAMRKRRLDEAGRAAVVLAVAGLAVSTFLRSSIVENNDFGMRSILIAQFFMLLLAILWWEGGLARAGESEVVAKKGKLRTAMVVMAWIGMAGTVYQTVMLRVYLPAEERLGQKGLSGLAERAMAWRRGFDAMDARVGRNAVVQYNTTQPGEFFYLSEVMHVGRQVASGQPGCGVAFGGEAIACKAVEDGVARLFAREASLTQSGVLSAAEARDECKRLGIDDLVSTRWDAVWNNSKGWVWTLPVVVDTNEVRVVDCVSSLR